jgi:hypothetical protein
MPVPIEVPAMTPFDRALPYARTFDEAYLYLDLRPCPCGETDFDRTVSTVSESGGDTGRVVRLGGECVGCGRQRVFSFEMPDELPDLAVDVRYGDGSGPSRLLDAGEWLGIAELFEGNARDQLAAAGQADDGALSEVAYLAAAAVAATDEVLLFLGPGTTGDDTVPEGAFWSQAGRTIFELDPDRFRRDRLATERQSRLRLLEELDRP